MSREGGRERNILSTEQHYIDPTNSERQTIEQMFTDNVCYLKLLKTKAKKSQNQ